MKQFILLLGLLFITFNSFSQRTDEELKIMINTLSESKLLAESSRVMLEGRLYQAEMIVDKLLTFQPNNPNYNYRKGYLLLEINKDYSTALPYLTIAITDTKPYFDAINTKEKSAPADAFYHLASCYHFSRDIDKAVEYYNLFLQNTYSKSPLVPITQMKLKQCIVAKELIDKPVEVTLINIGQAVNGQYPDYSPVVSLDGSALYFTSRRPWSNNETFKFRDPILNQFPEDVYVSYMDFDFTWTESMRLDFCYPERNEATIGISADERRIYLYEDSTGSGDIYYSDFYAQKFKDITALNIKGINTEYWETHCNFSHDQKMVFFSSDRPGGFGGRDLYVLNKISDSSWTEPINLGPKINSPFDEDAPFVSVDNKILYYSSNGQKSIGGFDVLVSELSSDGNWSESRNVGYPFNSTFDDIFYTTTIDGLKGYMTSDRPNGFGEKDIYEINNNFLGVKSLAVLKGLIRTRDRSPLPEDFAVNMTLKCLDCDDSEKLRIMYPRVRDGIFITDLKPCKTYELTYVNVKDNKNMYKDKFTTECISEYQEIYREVILDVENKRIIPVIKYTIDGVIADRKTAEKLPNAKIEVIDLTTNDVVETVVTDKDGNFKLTFADSKTFDDQLNVQIKVSKENYLTQTFDLIKKLGDEEKIHLNYLLEKATIGSDISSTFAINPIYFDFDKSNIRPDAKIELDKIVKIMNDNPTLEIEFTSHTDCRGSEKYNLALSQRRAKSSETYIKSRITNPNRISGKGYGESKLVNNCSCENGVKSNCSEEQHQQNRRTEFIIVK